jgi:hypothetical protein
MSTKNKWYQSNHPAFNKGELWLGAGCPELKCWIDRVEKFGDGKFDYQVYYHFSDGTRSDKDIWNFQVKYYYSDNSMI